jgi:hypothetical protein
MKKWGWLVKLLAWTVICITLLGGLLVAGTPAGQRYFGRVIANAPQLPPPYHMTEQPATVRAIVTRWAQQDVFSTSSCL